MPIISAAIANSVRNPPNPTDNAYVDRIVTGMVVRTAVAWVSFLNPTALRLYVLFNYERAARDRA
jgi:hypothetical protein